MSLGPLGMIGSAAGSQLPQTKGTDVDKAQQDAANQARQTESGRKAESASGVGETEQDEQASDRDADGRRIWEAGLENEEIKAQEEEQESPTGVQSKDPTGQSGSQLDLTG